jgi:hypothetical protein
MKDVHFKCSNPDCGRWFAVFGLTDDEVGPVGYETIKLKKFDARCPMCHTPDPVLLAVSNSKPSRNLCDGDRMEMTVEPGSDIFVRIKIKE